MVMRSLSKEKTLANLMSKFMSDNDQPVNSPLSEFSANHIIGENLVTHLLPTQT